MFSKSLMALAVAGVMASGSALAVTTPTPITLTSLGGNSYTGSFSASATEDNFSITFPTGLSNFTSALIAFTLPGFYTPTAVTFDNHSFTKATPIAPYLTAWNYNLNNITAGTYNIKVTGAGGGSATGFVQFTTAVPEPATITMMLAGLALVGGLQLRGKKKTSQLAG